MSEPLVNIAIRAARAASLIITRSLNHAESIQIMEKAPHDYVTEVDQRVEKEIIYIIQKAYPAHSILSEETGEILGKDKDILWIIDPLDGTRNFIHGIPHYAISIA